MSRKHFSWLLLATVAAALIVLLVPGRTGRESSPQEILLVPDLAQQVNEIDWLHLAAGGGTIATLVRDDNTWVVEEASSYRADWSQVKNLLASLSRVEVVERKTSNPELYPKLGVEDVTGAEAAGVLIEFADNTGLPAVIIGNIAQGRAGQYARLADSQDSALIEPVINLPRDQSDWLDGDIIDISDAEVVEFEIRHPGGESVRAVKASADDENFELQAVPADREIKSEWGVNAPANALAALELQAVVPATQLDWDDAIRFRLLTADGLTVEADLLTIEKEGEAGDQPEQWIRLQASVYQESDGSAADGSEPAAETGARAEQINSRVGGWAYRIPAYRFDSMTRSMEDLLKPAGDENEPAAL